MKKFLICIGMVFCLFAVPTLCFAESNEEPIIVPDGSSFETSADWNTEGSAEGMEGEPPLRAQHRGEWTFKASTGDKYGKFIYVY